MNRVNDGPAGALESFSYDEIDATPFLKAGKNEISHCQVLRYGTFHQVPQEPGLLQLTR